MSRPTPEGGLSLVGYRGTGKTSVGRILAHRLGLPFADTDREVEARAGKSIRAIFAEEGETAFRDLESEVLQELSGRAGGTVVATGGGAVLRPENREALRRVGFVAWLAADPETLARRLRASRRGVEDRPALTAAGTLGEIAEVLEARIPLYRMSSDVAIETAGLSPEQVADGVLDAWSRDQGR